MAASRSVATLLAAVLTAVLLYACAPFRASAANPAATDELIIRSLDQVSYNLENGELKIPGKVHIALGKLLADGTNLYYNNEKMFATLDGSPAVDATFDTSSTLTAGHLSIDFGKEILKGSKDCKVTRTAKNSHLTITAPAISVDMAATMITSDSATAIYKSTPPAGEKKSGEIKPLPLNTSNITIASGRFTYNYDTGDITADGPITITLTDGTITAGAITGNLESKKLTATAPITGDSAGTRWKADRVELDYAAQEFTATGNLEVSQPEKNVHFTAKKLWMRYSPGQRDMKVEGGVNATMKIKKKTTTPEGAAR